MSLSLLRNWCESHAFHIDFAGRAIKLWLNRHKFLPKDTHEEFDQDNLPFLCLLRGFVPIFDCFWYFGVVDVGVLEGKKRN